MTLLHTPKPLTLAAAMVLTQVGAVAQPASILQRVAERALPVYEVSTGFYRQNPASMLFADSLSVSDVGVSGSINRQKTPVMQQLGDGSLEGTVFAESFMPLSRGVDAAWGNASFTAEKVSDVRFSDVIDYRFVAPYVLGDDTGGDISSKRYCFGGGYVRALGSRLTLGAHFGYRAQIAHRSRDPRIKTIVSDLDISLGATFALSRRYLAGLDGSVKVYSQNCDLDFYNPVNTIQTLTLTGLGTYYQRFMGNSNKNSGHEAFGWSAGLQLLPRDKHGLKVNAGVRSYRMNQLLRNFNNITLGFTDNILLQASASWDFRLSGAVTLAPVVTGSHFSRDGSENVFGSASGSNYEKLDSRKVYADVVTQGRFDLPVQWTAARGHTLTFTPSVAFAAHKESYDELDRLLKVRLLTPGMAVSYVGTACGRWLFEANAYGSRTTASGKVMALPGLVGTTPLGACVISNYRMLSSDRTTLAASVGVSREWGGILYGLEAGCSVADYGSPGTDRTVFATLSVKF